MIIAILFAILLLLYCGMQCYLWFLWMRKPPVMGLGSQDPWPPVTVIVPVRNEEDHLRNCLTALLSQEYPGSTMQVIVVDDHSTDRTLDIARDFVNVEVISLPTGKSGKKMAIQAGIQAAQADVLVTVDGDCVMGAQWLATMVAGFQQPAGDLITGPVWMLPASGSFIEKYQEMEQAALNVLTYSGVKSGLIVSTNGANMSYSKTLFARLQPYAENRQTPSGDDVFFAQKVFRDGGRIQYVANPDAIVYTDPTRSFVGFVRQRLRWAGKSTGYKHFTTRLYLALFGVVNVGFVVVGIAGLWYPVLYPVWLVGLMIKFLTDYLIIGAGMRWGQRPVCWPDVLQASLFQVFYVIYITGLIVIGRKSEWKGRSGSQESSPEG